MVLLSMRKLSCGVGLWLVLAGLSVRLAKADTIFSNFGSGMTYNTTVSWNVSGSNVNDEVIAHEFMATGDFTFTDAKLAVGLLRGTNSVSVYLETNSAAGVPGTILEQIDLTGLASAFGG